MNDIVYVPLETPLARRGAGARQPRRRWARHAAASGRGPGFAAWFGVEPEVTPALRRALVATLLK